jgi:hypothetical protein
MNMQIEIKIEAIYKKKIYLLQDVNANCISRVINHIIGCLCTITLRLSEFNKSCPLSLYMQSKITTKKINQIENSFHHPNASRKMFFLFMIFK